MNAGRLHVVTDTTLQSRYSHAELAGHAARGGADVVQLRHKIAQEPTWWRSTGTAVREAIAGTDCRLIVNDRIDVAEALGAGVHLGRDDDSVVTARHRLGAQAVIGRTANSLDEARALEGLPVSYLGVGPVYGTRSKARPAPALGVETLARIVAAAPVPVIAIGGITEERIGEVLDAGAHGVAVLSAFVCAPRPDEAVAALARSMEVCRAR